MRKKIFKIKSMRFRKERLKSKEFEEVLKKGKSIKENKIVLKFLRNKFETTRFGFLVSKKVSKKAVVRNKIKRRLREILRKKTEKIKKGLDLVFIPLPGIEKEDFEGLKNLIERLLRKAKILK